MQYQQPIINLVQEYEISKMALSNLLGSCNTQRTKEKNKRKNISKQQDLVSGYHPT